MGNQPQGRMPGTVAKTSPSRRSGVVRHTGAAGAAKDKAAAVLAAKKLARKREREGGLDFVGLYRATPYSRIATVKAGLPAVKVKKFVSDLDMPIGDFFGALQLSQATFNRKVLKDQSLSTDESERVVGFLKLFGQVQVMVEESGETADFDARAWTVQWLEEPLAALGGLRPVELMDTIEGQQLVSAALARIQSGAYG